MIKDFDEFEAGASMTGEHLNCWVHSGKIEIAREFIGSRHTIVILESGGIGLEPENVTVASDVYLRSTRFHHSGLGI